MSFSLIIPTLNEYENLLIVLPKIVNITDDVIIIDGPSNDGTQELCEKFNVRYMKQKSIGKGNALLEAVSCSKYDVVCFFDADLAHDPGLIPKLVNPILNNDCLHVCGSRMLGGSSELFADYDHFFRLFGSLIINYAISIKFKYKMTDCQNGFRAIHKSLLNQLTILSDHTTIEQELVGKTLALGVPVLEVPAHEYSRIHGESKINIFKHGPAYIVSLIKILLMKRIPIDPGLHESLKKKYPHKWY
jgi:glycosyltransferase involved in cell wall biosynthesis